MPDTPEKRRREQQKRRKREVKAERKRLRKEGKLGVGPDGQPLVPDAGAGDVGGVAGAPSPENGGTAPPPPEQPRP